MRRSAATTLRRSANSPKMVETATRVPMSMRRGTLYQCVIRARESVIWSHRRSRLRDDKLRASVVASNSPRRRPTMTASVGTSFGFHAGFFHHWSPFGDFRFDEFAELGRAHTHRRRAFVVEIFLGLGGIEQLGDGV